MPSRSPVIALYSGDKSRAFWKRVKRLPEPNCSAVYALACALQDLEHRVLTALRNAEAMEERE